MGRLYTVYVYLYDRYVYQMVCCWSTRARVLSSINGIQYVDVKPQHIVYRASPTTAFSYLYGMTTYHTYRSFALFLTLLSVFEFIRRREWRVRSTCVNLVTTCDNLWRRRDGGRFIADAPSVLIVRVGVCVCARCSCRASVSFCPLSHCEHRSFLFGWFIHA
jgi:hypothetical protein